jgi:hypothetical protein
MAALLKDKKNWIILALLIIVAIGGIFGGKAVTKFNEDIAVLKFANKGLGMQIITRDLQIKVEQNRAGKKQATIDSCMIAFKSKDKKIWQLERNLNSALVQLDSITSDSSYVFLTTVAYNFPGTMEYLFNSYQVKGIHADWLRARGMEKIIPQLKDQISNCEYQFNVRDSLVKHLNKIVDLQDKNLKDCSQINENDKAVIADIEKKAEKEKRRKGLWRTIAAIEPVILVVLMAL